MKSCFKKLTTILVLLALAIFHSHSSTTLAQGTAFTYQGQLTTSNGPAAGNYNFTFTLFTNNTGGTAIAGPVTNNAVAVTNGLFTTIVDFGAGVFNGTTDWLQLAVETNGAASFTNLSPRQLLTPTPYAIYAEGTSNLLGTVTVAQLPDNVITNNDNNVTLGGTFTGIGTGLQTLTTLAYFYAYSLANQANGAPAIWVPALFGNNGPFDPTATGWTYAAGTFTCNQPGIYLVSYDAELEQTIAGVGSASLRAQLNGAGFIPGSQVTDDTGAWPVNTFVPVSKSFLLACPAGSTLQIQFTSNVAAVGAVSLVTGIGVPGANQPSASLTIVRIQ